MGITKEILTTSIDALRERNPMLGLRGCRVGITDPDIYEAQLRAIFGACATLEGGGVKVKPEIMIPLVSYEEEVIRIKHLIAKIQEDTEKTTGLHVEHSLGVMIETPRACLIADKIASQVDFFSFGTNDLTQMTVGLSRDDASRFLATYTKEGLISANPFFVLDKEGVGQLIELAVERGRRANPDLRIGVCGEHGGDPTSIKFLCDKVDYVSCVSTSIPTAKLTLAQEEIR